MERFSKGTKVKPQVCLMKLGIFGKSLLEMFDFSWFGMGFW